MHQMAVTIAVAPPNSQPRDAYVTVKPLLDRGCPFDQPDSMLSGFNVSSTYGNWSIFDVVYSLGPLPAFACQLPRYAQLTFQVPDGYDIRIAALRISGVGSPPAGKLEQIDSFNSTPNSGNGILSNMLFVYIAAAVGALIILFLLLLLWFCCGKPTCCGSKKARALYRCAVGLPGKLIGTSCAFVWHQMLHS
jgi:hypothetical protein